MNKNPSHDQQTGFSSCADRHVSAQDGDDETADVAFAAPRGIASINHSIATASPVEQTTRVDRQPIKDRPRGVINRDLIVGEQFMEPPGELFMRAIIAKRGPPVAGPSHFVGSITPTMV